MYKSEESVLFNSILNRLYFNDENDKFSLELMVNGKCDLKCKYCYINKFGDKLFPNEIHKDEVILNNIDYLFDWLDKNNHIPSQLLLFSGELLSQEIGWKILKKSIDFYKGRNLGGIVIPSNMNFVFDNDKLELFDSLHEEALNNNTSVNLSASVDGLYCDSNREFRSKDKQRDYDKIFKFCKEYNYSFHPMIYCDEIENWNRNFLWFQEMFKKHNIPWKYMYLLEVRNVEWTTEKIAIFYDFISFVVEWAYHKIVNELKLDFYDTVFKERIFNLFSMFTTSNKGLGCSIQSYLHLRCADLSIFPCHRLAYKYFKLGELNKDTGEMVGVNPTLLSAIHSADYKSFPYCEVCIIKHFCNGQCLGSMFETTGDMFTPIPTVCMLEHAKVKAVLTTLSKLGILPEILGKIHDSKRDSINMIMEK